MSYIVASKNAARRALGVLLATPPFFALLAGLVQSVRRDPPAAWLPMAEYVLLGWAIYALSAPFIVEVYYRRGAIKRPPQLSPEFVVLLMGVATASTITALAFMLMVCGGAPARDVYVSAPISVAAALFWCWRYRQALP